MTPAIAEKRVRVLHVDDDEDDRMFLAEALQNLKIPHELTSAAGCMDLVKIMSQGREFDLILMDVNMPMINGRQCLKKIKADERYSHVPVVIFTVSYSPDDIEDVYRSGAHYHVIKPFSSMNFSEALKKIFEIDWKANPPVPSREDFVINFAFA